MTDQQTANIRLQIRINWKLFAVAILMIPLLLKLGFWQLSRAEEKRQYLLAVQQKQSAEPISIESLDLDETLELDNRSVVLSGHYINERQILLVNKLYGGQLGYEVLTAFRLTSSRQVVLVSRGWIYAGYTGKQLPEIPAISGERALIAEVHVPKGRSFFLKQEIKQPVWPLRLQRVDIDEVAKHFDQDCFPYVVRLKRDNPGALVHYWPINQIQPGRSTSYAYQWFAMAAGMFVLLIVSTTNILEIIRLKQP